MENILNLIPVEIISLFSKYIDMMTSVALSTTVVFLVRKVLRKII